MRELTCANSFCEMNLVLVADARLESLAHLIKSFCNSQFPHKSVNSSFISAVIRDKLTDLCRD